MNQDDQRNWHDDYVTIDELKHIIETKRNI